MTRGSLARRSLGEGGAGCVRHRIEHIFCSSGCVSRNPNPENARASRLAIARSIANAF